MTEEKPKQKDPSLVLFDTMSIETFNITVLYSQVLQILLQILLIVKLDAYN